MSATPNFVTITSSARAEVISEKIVDDGRERHENGRSPLEPGVSRHFIIDSTQSLRIVEYAEPPKVEPVPEPEAAPATPALTTKKGE